MDLLLQHIHQETGLINFIETSSLRYNLSEEVVQKFTDAVISSVLGAILLQGDTPETEDLLNTYNSRILEDTIEPTVKINLTIETLNKIFNDKLPEFYSILSEYSNIELNKVSRMTIILSELFITQLPQFMASEKYSISGLLGHLLGERDYFIDQMPDDILTLLDISSKHSIGQNISADAVVVSNAVRYTLLREKKEQAAANRKKSWFEKIFKKG